MYSKNNKPKTYANGRTKHVVPRKDEVSTFRLLSEEEIIQIKTIIRDLPRQHDAVAYHLYKKLEGKPKNKKITVRDGNQVELVLTFEQEFYWNTKKLNLYKGKVLRSLDFKAFPKGTGDTSDVVDIVRRLAQSQTIKRATSSLAIGSFVTKVGKLTPQRQINEENFKTIDKIGD